MKRIRIDFAIAFLVAFGVGSLINFGAGKVIDRLEETSKEMVYSDTKIGAAAGKGTPVAYDISDMMEEDCFTVHLKEGRSLDSLYYDKTYYHIYELDSEEVVLVDEYFYNSYYDHDEDDTSFFPDSYEVLPVGRVVMGQLDDELIEMVEEKGYTLTETSFYIDMRGDFKYFSREDYEDKAELLSFGAGLIVFFLIRYLMIASGVFSPVIPLRFLKSWKRFVNYYGIIYYGDGVKQIAALRKKGKMDEAAYGFSKLIGVDIEEAQMAMQFWSEIYGEGILKVKKL
ncbi:MAG: hypothetical protein HDR24_01110 [Lachnospiraceae bacterium]|nr:hypothetical protein [Lachnospiraceae bacterium]